MTAAIVLFMFMGAAGGYHAARLYKTLKGSDWKKGALLTATLYPSTFFGMGFFLNFSSGGETLPEPYHSPPCWLCCACGLEYPSPSSSEVPISGSGNSRTNIQ
ncbi:Transmembrane 9 superfamily member 4 [Geodia barretti]|uniref:Transmembrane 9 superfamily member n=1 Tax=Geodia barretti TaxID=519541 RepID=A0AA35U0M1_GEOBA|nr:Transmembrane 9 superfamily member 4 [Geodia barretti]